MYDTNTIKGKIKSKFDVYKEELDSLKSVCETVGITTANQMRMLISNLEKELSGAFSITEKRLGSIFIAVIFTGCFCTGIIGIFENPF